MMNLWPMMMPTSGDRAGGHRGRRLLLAGLVALCVTGPLYAQSERVREVLVRNRSGMALDSAYVLAHTTLREGDDMTAEEASRDVRLLLDTKRFSYVGIEVEEVPGGVRLIYVLDLRYVLARPVEINGAEHFRHGKIVGWLAMEPGDYVDEQILSVACERVRQEYESDYYPDAEVTGSITVTDAANGLATVTVTVDEGHKAKVKSVTFSGNPSISAAILTTAVGQRRAWHPLYLFRRQRYDADELEIARLGIRDLYLDRGFLDVSVPEGVVSPAPERPKQLTVHFEITEGVQYHVGRIAIEGTSLFPESELRQMVRVVGGDVASRSEISASEKGIRDYYGGRGYVDTLVRAKVAATDKPGVVDITFAVQEGSLAHIRNIMIRGNTRTRDKVIRREILVDPGDIYDEVRVARSERRLQNLGFFSSVRSYDLPTALAGQRDLVYEVEEQRTGQFMVGAGFSSVDNIVGFMEITQSNFDIANWPYFSGGGQKLKLSANVGSVQRDFEISLTEPWFLDRKLSLTTRLYQRNSSFRQYDALHTGGSIGLTKAFPWVGRVGLDYQLDHTELSDLATEEPLVIYGSEPPQPYSFTEEDDDYISSTLKLLWTYDTRNSPFAPSRGARVDAFGALTGGPLGFDTQTYKLGATGKQYFRVWRGHIIKLVGRLEVIEGFGDDEYVPIDSRLFLGGGRTLRGFKFREVGPKAVLPGAEDPSTAYWPVGGKTLFMATAEYTVPIPVTKVIRLAAFYDTGNVWSDAFDVDFADLASSAGVGVRLDMPGFPIRIDYARVIDSDDELTRDEPWVIWIGYD